eukprot:857279-Rhodomonas_salina.2
MDALMPEIDAFANRKQEVSVCEGRETFHMAESATSILDISFPAPPNTSAARREKCRDPGRMLMMLRELGCDIAEERGRRDGGERVERGEGDG